MSDHATLIEELRKASLRHGDGLVYTQKLLARAATALEAEVAAREKLQTRVDQEDESRRSRWAAAPDPMRNYLCAYCNETGRLHDEGVVVDRFGCVCHEDCLSALAGEAE